MLIGVSHNAENERKKKEEKEEGCWLREACKPNTHGQTAPVMGNFRPWRGGGEDGRLSITKRTTQNQRRTMGVLSSSKIQAEVREVKNRKRAATQSKRKVEAENERDKAEKVRERTQGHYPKLMFEIMVPVPQGA